MMRMTDEEHRSRVRVAELSVAIATAIASIDEVTYSEILAALAEQSRAWTGYLLAAERQDDESE